MLTIAGDGVKKQSAFTLAQLKSVGEAPVAVCYSVVNNWPSRKFYVGKGVPVSDLLQKAGLKDTAQTIIVRSSDGYQAQFTREQLEEKRFSFPDLLQGGEEGAREVPAILAWEHREGTTDLDKAAEGGLYLLLGQKGLNDVVAAAYVKDAAEIEVSNASPGQWTPVQAEPASGRVKRGTEIVFSHEAQDQVKIYYTLDGSVPSEKSFLYNPSTSYYQPDLFNPATIEEPVTVQAVAIGFGKHDSQVATFVYEVE